MIRWVHADATALLPQATPVTIKSRGQGAAREVGEKRGPQERSRYLIPDRVPGADTKLHSIGDTYRVRQGEAMVYRADRRGNPMKMPCLTRLSPRLDYVIHSLLYSCPTWKDANLADQQEKRKRVSK